MVIGKEVGKETNVNELNYHEYVFGYTIGQMCLPETGKRKVRMGVKS